MVYKNIASKDTIKRRTIAYMKELNVYKKQYNQLIEVYSDLLLQYYILTKQFEETGYEVVVATEKKARFLHPWKILGKTLELIAID